MKFSIITVVKNDNENIERTIKSVLSQKNKNFEYIICDGNSTDGTTSIINKYKKFSKIKIFKKKDKNLYEAINNGIKKAKGNYIFLIHSGDIFASRHVLQYMDKKIKHQDIITSNIQFYNKKNIKRNWNYKVDNLNSTNIFKIAHTSTFIRKKLLLKKKLYNTSYSIASDTDFFLKLSKDNLLHTHIKYLSIYMLTGGLSGNKVYLLKKIKEDLNIYYENYRIFFLYHYLKKIMYKLLKFIFQNKVNSKKLIMELNRLNEFKKN